MATTTTPTGIGSFIQTLKKTGGISASNLYSFDFAPLADGGLNKFIKDNTGSDLTSTMLQLVCNEIQLPGVTYSATDVKSVNKGITQKIAGSKVYNELDISFYMDANSTALQIFRAWQDFITGGRPVKGVSSLYGTKIFGETKFPIFVQQYYHNYACELTINKLEKYTSGNIPTPAVPKEGQKPQDVVAKPPKLANSWKARLYKAYPYTVSSVPYSAAAAQLVKVSVGFYYEYSNLNLPETLKNPI